MIARRMLCLLGCLWGSYITLSAQLNILVGYSAQYTQANTLNTLIDQYNDERPWLEDRLDQLNTLQGLNLGLRYRTPRVAVELGWVNNFSTFSASGTDPNTNALSERELRIRLRTYYLALENTFGKFGYGLSFGVNHAIIRTEKTGRSDAFNVMEPFNTSSRIFVSYTIDAGPFLFFSIRPYISIPWTSLDFTPLAEELELESFDADQQGNFPAIGISLLLFNGE